MKKDLLLKLAEHLESGKLSVDAFSLEFFKYKRDCGTVGCALGECPAIWPGDWKWLKEPCGISDIYRPVLNGDKFVSPVGSAIEFFEI